MCDSCGCGQPEQREEPQAGKDHGHEHLPDGRVIRVRRKIMDENDRMAERNRGFLEAKGARCMNIVGSPGSGKTTLLERTCMDLGREIPLYVIEGDQESSLDAERIRAAGVEALQINTEYGCHLDAAMVNKALRDLGIKESSLIFIENVGNLVCPALFDLGEKRRVVVYSVTEGNDKPLKYPYMFRSAHLVIITKTDLIPYVDFDLGKAHKDISMTNPVIQVIELSVKSGEGVQSWHEWLKSN